MESWHTDLAETLDRVWAGLSRGVADRRAPARHPVLATVGLRGFAEARTVVLRGAERAQARLELHTDAASSKVSELAANPGATVHVWDAKAQLQMRARVRVSVLTGEAVAGTWAQVPPAARTVYGGRPEPGCPLDAPEDHCPGARKDRFAVLDCRVAEIETLHLGKDLHRRALFAAEEGWRGRWLAP